MTQVFQTVHPQNHMANLWNGRWRAKDIGELRVVLVAQFGPFPILFASAHSDKFDGHGAGVVITGLAEFPGASDRTEAPFLGAYAMGYVPAIGHNGQTVLALNKVITPAWDVYTQPAAPVDPMKGSRPDLLGKPEEMPEPDTSQQQVQRPGR